MKPFNPWPEAPELPLIEDNQPLVTPDFIGTDEEKIQVLSYWSDLISLIRVLGVTVVSHENKLAIVTQLKKELDLVDLDVNNATSVPVTTDDGNTVMSKDPASTQDAAEKVINLAEPEDPAKPPSLFAPQKITTTEQMQRLAGLWYTRKKK